MNEWQNQQYFKLMMKNNMNLVWKEILDQLPEGIVIINQKEQIKFANNKGQQLFEDDNFGQTLTIDRVKEKLQKIKIVKKQNQKTFINSYSFSNLENLDQINFNDVITQF
eukprot:TRINITY_DN35974_c0_g1_i1.p2 TRINITY_DN35974_c0_g1~~TRINITY_DN35974_c0_g1_i1.p2  ORF type:complete len:110 (-),score=27.15 TRINITY_DN35974_c0_g1_i1:184-513(-)